MKIVRVDAVPLAAAFKTPFKFGHVTRTTSANVLVRVESEDGYVGWGEACPVPQVSAETQALVCDLVHERVAPAIIGSSPLAWRPTMRHLTRALYHRPVTLAGVSTALLDLASRVLDVPAYDLLGGSFRDSVEIHGSVTWHEDAQVMADTALGQAEKVHTLKVYLGAGEVDADMARLATVRDAVGDDHPFMIDANELWSASDVRRAAPALIDLGVTAVEQPVHRHDLDGMRDAVDILVNRHGIDLIADEAVEHPRDAVRVARERTAQTVNIGVSKLGGPFAALETAMAATAAGLQVTIGSLAELGVATAAGMHLAAAVPEVRYPSNFLGQLKYAVQVTTEDFVLVDSRLRVPAGPGLGVTVDETAVRQLDARTRG